LQQGQNEPVVDRRFSAVSAKGRWLRRSAVACVLRVGELGCMGDVLCENYVMLFQWIALSDFSV